MAGIFVTYRKYRTLDEAAELLDFLEEHRVNYTIVNNSPTIDITFSLNRLDDQVEIKIRQEDFSLLDSLLQKKAEDELDQVDKEHYLFGFTDEELMEVLEKPDEWTIEDEVLAKKILTDRGKHINTAELKEQRAERLVESRKPEKAGALLLITGFLFAAAGAFVPFWWGKIFISLHFVGMTIGFSLFIFNKVDIEGNRYPVFDKKTRKIGLVIFVISLVSLVISFCLIFT
jgi:hypothetical protein